MPESKPESRWRVLLRPSASRSMLSLLAMGTLVGAVGLWGFDAAMHATSSDAFCTSCHEMTIAAAQLQKTSHFNNRTGVRATCADCHVPREFLPKVVRKVEAAREVWGSVTGIIDTPEKYAAHTPAMKRREVARLRASDSRECRNCHDTSRMLTALQSAKAQRYHAARRLNDKTCIDCHAGIAHPNSAAELSLNGPR